MSCCAQRWHSTIALCTQIRWVRNLDSQNHGQFWDLRGNHYLCSHSCSDRKLLRALCIQEPWEKREGILPVSTCVQRWKPVARKSNTTENTGETNPSAPSNQAGGLRTQKTRAVWDRTLPVSTCTHCWSGPTYLCTHILVGEKKSIGTVTKSFTGWWSHHQRQQDHETPEKTWWQESSTET